MNQVILEVEETKACEGIVITDDHINSMLGIKPVKLCIGNWKAVAVTILT